MESMILTQLGSAPACPVMSKKGKRADLEDWIDDVCRYCDWFQMTNFETDYGFCRHHFFIEREIKS